MYILASKFYSDNFHFKRVGKMLNIAKLIYRLFICDVKYVI